MSGIGWQAHLDESSTQAQIVSICNQFLAVWSQEGLAQLPEACRPKNALALEEVSPYAVQLALQLEAMDIATASMLHRMSRFFTKAALRLAEIRPHLRSHAAQEHQLHIALLSSKVLG